jgi:hypothetical protein
MPQILTTSAQIVCPHGGLGTTTPSSTKWQINAGYVSVENDIGVLACPFLPLPCGGYQLRSMGLNASQIDGRKVILVTDFNQSFTGLPLLMAEFHQVLDNSTPAPIPPGGSVPPLSPELADAIAPIVAPPFQSLPFVTASTPPPLVVTFTLAGAFPNLWVLTLISRSLKQSFDLTNGIPGQVEVSPSGGDWQTASLTVTVTLSPMFLAGLGIGIQDIYMTAVSRRGLSGYGWAMITVS